MLTVSRRAREILEHTILDVLDHNGKLSTFNLRLLMKEKVKRPPITDRRVARICQCLWRKGKISKEKVGRKTWWGS